MNNEKLINLFILLFCTERKVAMETSDPNFLCHALAQPLVFE